MLKILTVVKIFLLLGNKSVCTLIVMAEIHVILVEDSENNMHLLENQIKELPTEVSVSAKAYNVQEAIAKIDEQQPELIFLDIKLPDGTGFDVLQNVSYKNFEVIFVTAYNEYALKAFEFSAIHYLTKPIERTDLQEAIERYKNSRKDEQFDKKINTLNENLNNQNQKMLLPASDGFTIVELDDIIHAESNNNYTTFYLNTNEKIMVSKPINTYEKLLSDLHFSRVHNKHIINLKYVKKYVKGRGGYVILTNNSHIDVSEGRKKDFMDKLKLFARN